MAAADLNTWRAESYGLCLGGKLGKRSLQSAPPLLVRRVARRHAESLFYH